MNSRVKTLEELSSSEQAWREEVIETLYCMPVIDEIALLASEFSKYHVELQTVKKAMLSEDGPKYGLELASATFYYRILQIIQKKHTPFIAYGYLVNCYIELKAFLKKLNTNANDVNSSKKQGNDVPVESSVREKRTEFLNNLLSMVVDYGIVVTDPELAPGLYSLPSSYRDLPPNRRGPVIPIEYILEKLGNRNDYYYDDDSIIQFFFSLLNKYKVRNTLEKMLASMMKYLSQSVKYPGIASPDDSKPIEILRTIWCPYIASIIPKLPFWLPRKDIQHPALIQYDTFLGPFFSSFNAYPDPDREDNHNIFSPFIGTVGFDLNSVDTYGQYIGSRSIYDILSTFDSIRLSTDMTLNLLHDCIMKITVSGKDGKNAILNYISTVVEFNKPRTRIQSNFRRNCSDGFMHNISVLCMLLCEPFTTVTPSKINLIDPRYLFVSKLINGSDFIGIHSDTKERAEYSKEVIASFQSRSQGTSSSSNPGSSESLELQHNFVTESFFLTMLCNHVGILTICHRYTLLIKQIESVKEIVKKMRDDRDTGKWADKVTLMANEFVLKFNEKQLEELTCFRLRMDSMLKNPNTLDRMLNFYNFVLAYIVRCTFLPEKQIEDNFVNKVKDTINWKSFFAGNLQNINVELPNDYVPNVVKYTPEWILEDACDFFIFYLNHCLVFLQEKFPFDELISFIVIFLKNFHVIRNPYIQAKLVEILHTLVVPAAAENDKDLFLPNANPPVHMHKLAKKYLFENLINYYVEVEYNSMTNQFYERFKTRFLISQILRISLKYNVHKAKLYKYIQSTERFTKFALLLTNDVSYLLDESISKLKEIQHLEHEMANRTNSSSGGNDQSTIEENEANFRTLEEQATSYISLGNETLKLFHTIVVKFNIVEQFLTPEICERLATMLNYNLTALVGPKYLELKVKNPSKYMFEPRWLLQVVVDIYLKFINSDDFVLATSKDCRSYRRSTFEHAVHILTKNSIYSREAVEGPLMSFVERVEKKIESQNAYYDKIGDIPTEFLDPLVYSLMSDPVILPSSKVVVDRSTIKTHLLADEYDPYNRTPLKLSDVIENPELKEKIHAWLKSKNINSENDESKSNTVENNSCDTTDDKSKN